jgi:hypothetical protein
MSHPSAPARDDATRYLRVRFVFGLVGLAVLIGGVAYLGAVPGGLVLVALLGGLPLVSYVFGIRSLAGSVFTGLAMLAVIIATTLYVIGEASSTAALGYLTLLFVGLPLVAGAAFLERSIRSSSGSVLAGLGVLAVTIGTMLYLTDRSAAESFCNHANGLGNTMIEVGLDPLTSSEAERLVAFHPRFIGDGQALREDGLTESAQVAQVWAAALADIRDADSQAGRSAAYEHLRLVVRELYGSTGACPNIR